MQYYRSSFYFTSLVLLTSLTRVFSQTPSPTPVRRFPRPPAKYKVRLEKSVMIPMRDGVNLSTDIYFPENAGETLPVIVVRTPYNKNQFRVERSPANLFAGQGYVVTVQDVRGKFESEGEYIVSAADSNDGYDMVNWASKQAWSNGKVGTYGCSYLGENQMEMARLRNPNLAAMIPQAAGGSRNYFACYLGGAYELSGCLGWFRGSGSKLYFRPPPGTPRSVLLQNSEYFKGEPTLPTIDYRQVWRTLPLIDMMKKASGPPTDWDGFVTHEPGDPWWNQFGYVKDTDRFNVPALHVNSWYDFGVADTLKLFNQMQRNSDSDIARNNQFVIISPTAHCSSEAASEKTMVGERDLGDAQFDYWGTYVRWFDYWLKGIDNGITKMPKVQLYVMGKNQWRAENEWPLARTQYTKYYFHSDGHANSRFGTGMLNTELPKNEPADQYVYDPKTPTPSVGGPLCCTGTADAPTGAFDQSDVETRHDVLVYSTPVLERGIEVTGPLQVVLYVSSSTPDTDFTAKLVDVYPDGSALNVQESILRARYREGFDKKVWMKPGEVYEVRIDFEATSNYFGSGHRIRLEISSSNFPRFDRNLNTGGRNYDETEWKIATNSVHHTSVHPSHIILPVIPEGSR